MPTRSTPRPLGIVIACVLLLLAMASILRQEELLELRTSAESWIKSMLDLALILTIPLIIGVWNLRRWSLVLYVVWLALILGAKAATAALGTASLQDQVWYLAPSVVAWAAIGVYIRHVIIKTE